MSSMDQLRNIDLLRQRQERRLVTVLESWEAAKKHLESALALAEAREREFREVQEDVRRNLDALVLVIGMTKELGDEMLATGSIGAEENQPLASTSENVKEMAAEGVKTPDGGLDGLLRRSTRPLFSSLRRSA